MADNNRDRAQAELQFCESVLAKTADTILTETLRGHEPVQEWTHVPEGDAFDPGSGAQWFYHCHPREEPSQDETEHGHFHCFLRPEGRDGPIHHLIALSVDAYGRPLQFFTVNQWVVGDDWLPADETIRLLPRFDVHLARPGYLVNRWLTAMIRLHEDQIADLLRARDAVLADQKGDEDPRARRELEVLSMWSLADRSPSPTA